VYIADTFNNRIRVVSLDTGIITTVAGTGVAGYSGDGGPALNAMLNGPNGIAFDFNSSIYIADTYNNRIRVINGQNIITTVAGTGSYGYGGRDGLATLASLNNPLGVAWDFSTSRLYIADTNNNRIRVISNSGIISTVAGTGVAGYSGDSMLATTATISYPMKITTDGSGNLFIADTDNHRVRVITKSTGIITTVAGTGDAGYNGDGAYAVTATLFRPSDVALDPSGNIYIADAVNNRIRMVDVNTGIISTVAGTGVAGFSGYGGLATAATISQPLGIDIDASGTVYIADTFNSRVLAVLALQSPTQTPTATIAGSTLEINQVTLSTFTFFFSCHTVGSSSHNLYSVILLM
jgi:trimeric autotransporter adhesin